jgi:hypothetical protein
VCGAGAAEPLLKAFEFAEQITLENDAQGNIHSFLTPVLLSCYWDGGQMPKQTMLAMAPKYRQLIELFSAARAVSKPAGRQYIDQFISQSRFAEQWVYTIDKLAQAAQADRAAQAARQASDIHEMDRQLQLSLNLLDQSVDTCRAAISAWADAVRDRADLGALAALNYFGYQFLLSLRHLQYIRSNHWSIQL